MDHCAPIWLGLDPSERGVFYVRGREVERRARHHGITARSVLPSRRSPNRILLASWGDTPAGGPRHWVMVEHGSGQSYSEPHADAEPEWGHTCGLDLILTPNDAVARRNRIYHPHAVSAVVGSAKVERLVAIRDTRNANAVPTVCLTWHWNAPGPGPSARWAWPVWRDAVAKLATMSDDERGYRLIGSVHPRAVKHLRHWYRRLGVEFVADFEDVVRRADVLVWDNTSAGFEAMACGIPVVILDCPWYEGAVGEPRFGVGRDAGVRIGSGLALELHQAVSRTLADDPCAEARRGAVRCVYGTLSGSLDRSLAAIRALP